MKRLLLIAILIVSQIVHSEAQTRSGDPGGQFLRFYPNPATTTITFDFQKSYAKGYSVQIYNFLGKKMFEQNNVSDHTSINLSDFQRGVYIYQLFDNAGRMIETGKFQVSK